MSMLAERKQKQKYCLNPRGKMWSEDSNKFGQKMLEKMGWKNGKGLGAHENGRTEHVKISYKNDSKGMGFKENGEQWTEHEDKFSNLLQNLTSTEEPLSKTKEALTSLEKKSKNSRARVHYKKFTRGKDISRYSEKDLANIFGRKSLEKPKVQNQEENASVDDQGERKFGVETIKGGSMADYFRSKLGNGVGVLKKNGMSGDDGSEDEKRTMGFGFKQKSAESDEDIERPMGFGFKSEIGGSNGGFGVSSFENRMKKVKDVVDNLDESYERKKKKKKNKSNEEKTVVEEEETVVEEASNSVKKQMTKGKKKKKSTNLDEDKGEISFKLEEIASNESKDKKNKKKRKIEDLCENKDAKDETPKANKKRKIDGLINPAFEENALRVESNFEESNPEILHNKIAENPYEVKPKKKKLKKSSPSKDHEINEETEGIKAEEIGNGTYEEIATNPYEVKPKKKSKNAKSPSRNDDKSSVREEENEETAEIAENPYEVKPKKKKSKKSKQEQEINEKGSNEAASPTKKRKKSKEEGISNPAFDTITNGSENCEEIQVENPFEIKTNTTPKKKKKNKEAGIINDAFDNAINCEEAGNPEEDPNRKTKPKNKKSKKNMQGIDNPMLAQADVDVQNLPVCDDLVLNVSVDPVPILQTPNAKSARQQRRKSVRFSEVNEERIIPNNEYNNNMNSEYKSNINDLHAINDKVAEKQLKIANTGFVNNAFDIRSTDTSFYESNLETKKKAKNLGISNAAFNNVQENVQKITETIDTYQAQVENDLNEAKSIRRANVGNEYIGEAGEPVKYNQKLNDGVRISFLDAKLNGRVPHYMVGPGISAAKKSYKHLIKGDVIIKFKNCNLHKIKGYATKAKCTAL